MKHRTVSKYPAPSATVLKMFSDPAFHQKKLEALKLPKFQILEQKASGSEFRIRVERHVPVDAPGAVKKFVPAVSKVVNEEIWNSASKSGKVKAEPQGVPVTITCTVACKDEGTGCAFTYDWNIEARIPFVGGVLEKFVASDMEQRMAEETRIGAQLLAGYKSSA